MNNFMQIKLDLFGLDLHSQVAIPAELLFSTW